MVLLKYSCQYQRRWCIQRFRLYSMGNFLSALKLHEMRESQLSDFRLYSLSNIQQAYGKYKYNCDTFAIDQSQFTQIFGDNLKIFKMFDDDYNLLIDGLQLFAGLILFTPNCKFQDKIKFLFDIFDFNDENSLSKTDLEFLFISSCNACNKILGIKGKLKQDEIILLINETFQENRRVNINQMIKWTIKSKQIQSLFFIIEEKPKPLPDIQKVHDQKIYIKNKISNGLTSHIRQNKKQWLTNILKRVKTNSEYPTQIGNSDVKLQIQRVIGIRYQDVKSSMLHAEMDGKDVLLYSSACLIVIHLIGSSIQYFYSEHKNQVISICSFKNIVASAELAELPHVHIWDLKTKKTIHIISASHRKGIHILKFTGDGQQLITCGLGNQSYPIHIYETRNYTLQKSMMSTFPIVELTPVNHFKVVAGQIPQFLVGTTHSFYLLNYPLDELMQKNKTTFTCCQLVHLNSERKYLRYYQENDPGAKVLLTGSEDGYFCAWNLSKNATKIFEKKYTGQVIKIQYVKEFIAVSTFSSTIQFFNFEMKLSHTLDITSLGIKLLNYDIMDFISYRNIILVCTKSGQIIKLQEDIDNNFQYRAQRMNNVFSFKGKQNTAAILKNDKKQVLYIGGSEGTIAGVDLTNYQIVDIWRLSEEITALDVVNYNNKNYIAAGTKSGMIYLRINLQQTSGSQKCRKQITDIKFSIRNNKQLSLVSTCVNGKIYYFQNVEADNLDGKLRYQIQNQIPVSLYAEGDRVLINTENNNIYLMSLVDKKHREIKSNEAEYTITSHIFKIRFNHKELAGLDFVSTPKIVASANNNGGVAFWRDKQSFYHNKMSVIQHHKSKVSCIMITSSLTQIITIGKFDNTIIIYKVKFSQRPCIFSEQLVIEKPSLEGDDIIDREVAFCIYTNNLMNEEKDQHLLVRGLKHSILNTLLGSLMQKWVEMNIEDTLKNPPPLNLKLNHLYGLQSFERRNNLICLNNPRRYLYYASRVAVVQYPYTNNQEFYLGHRFKITSICLIDDKRVATGESASLPSIHVWNYQTMTTISILQTSFKFGIVQLSYSQCYIFACGLDKKVTFEDKDTPSFAFSIHNIDSGMVLGYRSEGLQKVYSMAANPINPNQFISTGNMLVNFWNLKGKMIQKVSQCFCDQTITASVYYYYDVNRIKKIDLIVGTEIGNIGVIVNSNKFIMLKQKAHLKFINCIKWIQLDSSTDLFITSSEDQTIKIWNKYFQCLFEQDIRKIQDYKQIFKTSSEKKSLDKSTFQHNLSVQSISCWISENDKNDLELLLSNRNGEILLLNYHVFQSKGRTQIILRNHSSQLVQDNNKRIFFAIHPKFDIMVTVGEDQNLFLWDVEKNKLITSKFLGYIASPTCIKFNKEGDTLAIGFSDGLLIFYDCKINKPNMAKSQQKYSAPNLSETQKNKPEKKSAILNIQFSDNGEFLAVSYDNCYSELKNGRVFIQPSYIALYNSIQNNKQHKKHPLHRPNDKLYSQIAKIPCQQGQTMYQTDHSNKYGMAAYYLTYLELDNKTYLLIYYQIVDSNQVRLNHLNQTKYILWDIDTSTIVVNFQLLNQIQWKKLNFPNSVSCRYQLYSNNSTAQSSQKLKNNNLLKADMTTMLTFGQKKDQNDYMILGSLNGDIHLALTCSIQAENSVGDQFLAKTVPAHTSFINQFDLDPSMKFLFSSGLDDQVVMKWKIVHEPKVQHITKQSTKFFKDQPKYDEFDGILQQFKQRNLINLLDFPMISDHVLQPYRIIGRRTIGLRSRVLYDEEDKIIYTIGPNILIYQKQKTNLQSIPSSLKGSIDEITCLMVSSDGRLCFTATAGSHVSLMIWEINSHVLLEKIILADVIYPIMIRVSWNNNRVVVFALDQKMKSMIIYIDVSTHNILGRIRIRHADSSSIRDGGFLNGSFNNFVTCGSNHITLWKYQGNQLVYQNLQVKLDKQPLQKFMFLCYLALDNKFVTGCHNGWVYLWNEDGKLLTKEQGHKQLCQNLASNGKYVLSVGRDMTLIVWNIESNRIYKDHVFDLTEYFTKHILQLKEVEDNIKLVKGIRESPGQQILSICMNGNKLLIDTKYGSIFQIYFQELRLNEISSCTQILNLNNRSSVMGMFFTQDSKYLYYITDKGVLSVWDILNFICIQQMHFWKQTIDMILCQQCNRYFIAFGKEVYVCLLNSQPNCKNSAQQQTIIQNIFTSKYQIKAIAIGKKLNQIMIAIAQKQNDTCKISVYYYFPNPEKRSKNTQLLGEKSKLQFKHSISMSFSTKGDELLIILDGKQFSMPLTLEEKKQISSMVSQREQPKYIFKNDSRTEKILQIYKNQKNPILQIKQIGRNKFLVGDTLGTLRLFEVQSEKKQPKLVDYSLMHLNEISKIWVSHDGRRAASYSRFDESIIIWNLKD